MKKFYHQRSLKEKISVLCISFFILLPIPFLVLNPMDKAIQSLQTRVMQNEQIATGMTSADQQMATLMTQIKPQTLATPTQLFSIIQQTGTQAQASTPGNITETSDHQVSITFESVPFDSLSQWIITLWKQYGIIVNQAAITKTTTPGIVNASVGFVVSS